MKVRSNKGAPGIDKMTIEEFSAYAEIYWQKSIRPDLLNGIYQPTALKRAIIEKDDGSERLLAIPTVCDRLIMKAIAQVLSPLFEPEFSDYSFGFRPNRSQKMAVKHVQDCIATKRHTAVDVDLSKFFDRVDHDYLMTKLGRKIKDKGLLELIGWINYFGIANQFQLCVDLDGWIRRRIRMCFWKNWRKVKTKIKNLFKLGIYKDLAIFCGMSSKSYWHSSKTEGIHKGLNDKFLKDLGLVSVKAKWVVIHHS